MTHNSRRTLSTKVVLGIMALASIGLFVIPDPSKSSATPTRQDNFMGGNPTVLDLEGTQTLRLESPAGSRSNWHSHTDSGQLLMVEEGLGRTQVRGGPIEVARAGEPWYTPAGVEHGHGAAPGEAAVQLTNYAGAVNWLEPVLEDEYMPEVAG